MACVSVAIAFSILTALSTYFAESSVVSNGGEADACSALESIVVREGMSEEIVSALIARNCPCGGEGLWRNIADLDFSDPNVACPSDFTLITTPVRGCGRSPGEAAGCKSVLFSANNQSYSRVCGRVTAYQKGSTDAFNYYITDIQLGVDEAYVDGVSLTHGAAGSRQHIWTFAAASRATYTASVNLGSNCPCINSEDGWPYQVYPFIDNNYFCATGNPGPGVAFDTIRTADPLWDGEGCGPTNTCCEFNNPPWFCTTLPQPTTDDVEMRVCSNELETNEDVILSFVNINIV